MATACYCSHLLLSIRLGICLLTYICICHHFDYQTSETTYYNVFLSPYTTTVWSLLIIYFYDLTFLLAIMMFPF